MTVLAHFGHWYVGMIYAAPVLILGAIIGWDMLRHRDEGREDDELDGTDPG